jgi:hypothetical protein
VINNAPLTDLYRRRPTLANRLPDWSVAICNLFSPPRIINYRNIIVIRAVCPGFMVYMGVQLINMTQTNSRKPLSIHEKKSIGGSETREDSVEVRSTVDKA